MMASDLSSGCTETIDILDDEKEEGEISLEDVSSSEEGGMGHLTSSYVVSRARACPDCKSWGECATWCKTYHPKSQSRRDPVKGKENRHHVKEMGSAVTKHTASTLQEKNDDLVPISSDSDMEIVGLTDTSNRSKAKVKKKKRKKKEYEPLTIDDLISPSTVDLAVTEVGMKIYREVSPVHRPSGRSKIISRSPIRRYKSPVATRSSFRSSRSPLNHSRSPIQKRSPRKVRSPKRSLRRHSPVRAAKRPPPKPSSLPSARSYDDRHGDVTRLLKKVKHLDSIGAHASEPSVNRSKESSSLKKKLSNILKRSDSDDHTMHLKGKLKVQSEIVNDADDEDDLVLLRQKALETKQKKSSRSSDYPVDVESEKRLAVNNDDQDEEALQLRMIALRSAVMKKHQNRVQRGIKTKRPTRSESPFSCSFLDDIPVPGDEPLKSPCTLSLDSNHIEDMDLDTDVEREKEKLPYSPTDKITEDVPIDTTLLGIEPSDVSFINVNETMGSPVFDDAQDFTLSSVMPYETYLPYRAPSTPQYYAHSPSQYGSETFHSDLNNTSEKGLENPHSDGIVCDLIDGICCQEGTYSSTHMSDTPHALPVSKDFTLPVSSHGTFASPLQMQQIVEQPTNNGIVFVNVDAVFRNDKSAYETQTASAYSVADVPTTTAYTAVYPESISPNESMITIDDLPENDVDPLNSLNGDDRNSPATEHIPKEAMPRRAVVDETLQEPLYMQGVPDVTKDMNKIPTLINRKLVPVSILKSNTKLRQRLKKRETPQPEPVFKSAEMQPVIVTVMDANSSVFKPIKLQAVKKSAPVLSALATFDNSTNEPLNESDDQKDSLGKNHEAAELEHSNAIDTPSSSEAIPAPNKKRKRVKKTSRKSLDNARLLENKKGLCSDADVNRDANIVGASTLDHTAIESDQSKSNDNADAQESSIGNGESSRLQGIDIQEFVNSGDVMTEKRDTEKNNHTTSVEYPQKEHIEFQCLSTHPLADNSDSGMVNRAADTTKSDSRRNSIDEDENELRAILLASLKRAKLTDTSSSPVAPAIPATNSVATNVQTSAPKTLAGTMPSIQTNSTCTASNNVPLLPKPATLPETVKKKISDVSTSVQNSSRKRNGSVDMVKSPPKKVTRKVLTSTKVVNNAKKFQNMIVQRRLNLRKLDNNAKPSESLTVWPNVGASKISPHASDTQRFVISLGSDTDSESEGERNEPVPVPVAEKHQPHQEIPADLEKKVNQFLREMRNEQEQSAAAAKSSSLSTQATKRDVPQTDNNSSNLHTPLAVRHLPVSQQEEYRRLKQEILEREKLKLQRQVASNNSSSSSGSSNKLSNANVASSPVKSLPNPCEKKTHVKQNQDKLKTPERNPQETLERSEIGRKSDDVTRGTSELNGRRMSSDKKLSENIAKHTNFTHLQTKSSKKAIPNNLSIRITNVIAPSNPGGRTVESSREKQSARDKQQHRPALRTLSKDEINHKYMQVMLKTDMIKRVVTINDKSALQHDTTASVGQSENLAESDVNTKILNEKNLSDIDDNNVTTFSNASTIKLPNLSANSSQHEETMETTMTLSQYEAERQQEINRDVSTSALADNNDNNNSSCKSDVVADDNGSANDVWDALKKDVKAELDSLSSLPEVEQERYLRETEYKLVTSRYTVLDHLAEMSGNLRQWDMEKDVQTTLANEVRKLKEQLKIAEEKLQQQRDRVSSMGPKVSTARQKINAGRHECEKLSRICSTLGNRLMGKKYKLPEAVAQLLSDKLKEIANHTRQFTKKRRPQSNDTSENSYSSLLQETSRLSNTCTEENLSLQEQSMNDAPVIDEAGSSRLTQSNQYESSSNILETLSNFSQVVPCQSTSEKREETSTNASEYHNEEQVTSLNQDGALSSEPKLYQSSHTEQNNEHREGNRTDESDPAASSELNLLAMNFSSQECNEQNNIQKRTSPQLPSSSPLPSPSSSPSPSPSPSPLPTTTTMTDTPTTSTTTTTTTKKKTIEPYVSILTHLKKPRNINLHGILCPYEMMGICRDEDCQYIHQSRNQT